MKVGILYIAIGKYWYFWNDFYLSCEKFFLSAEDKEYFVFTDHHIKDLPPNVTLFHQEDLGWPSNTLMRFKMFKSKRAFYEKCNYLFFFNANTFFLSEIEKKEILPTKEESYIMALTWHVYEEVGVMHYPYERNPESEAFISPGEGRFYYQGGINGGRREEYLQLIDKCEEMVALDLSREIIAVSHDESYLNKYLENSNIKVIGTVYGRPEEWITPEQPKVIFRNKNNELGTAYMDKLKSPPSKGFFRRFMQLIWKR